MCNYPVPVATRSKVWVCGRSPTEIVGSNPAGEVWMSVCYECCVCCQVEVTAFGLITRPEESYRVWCVWVWSWNIDKEEALAHWGGCCAMEMRNEEQPIGGRVFSGIIVYFRRADQRPSGVGHSGRAGTLRGRSVNAQTGRPNQLCQWNLVTRAMN